jgi:hypothetical protein
MQAVFGKPCTSLPASLGSIADAIGEPCLCKALQVALLYQKSKAYGLWIDLKAKSTL